MSVGGTANGASAVDAWVMRAGCSMRLSTLPRLSASFQIRVRATSVDRFLLVGEQERDHAAEVPHLVRGDGVPGMRRQARIEDALDARVPLEVARRSRRAFAQWRSMRTASVFTPRRTSHASNGPGTAPRDFCRNASRSAIPSSEVATKPPITSEWPPRYFVVECSATSAPSASGCWRYGVANVLSTTTQRAGVVRDLRGGRDVDDVQRRVRRGLQPDEPRVLVEVLGEAVGDLVGREEREAVALRLVDLREHPVDAAVDVVDGDDVVARREQVHERRGRPEPGRERAPVRGSLERGEALLQRGPRGVADPGVVVALVDADGLLHVGRGLVDRRRHGAGGRVRLLAVVDRAGLEVHRGGCYWRRAVTIRPSCGLAPRRS